MDQIKSNSKSLLFESSFLYLGVEFALIFYSCFNKNINLVTTQISLIVLEVRIPKLESLV